MALKADEFSHTTIGWHVQSKAPSPYTQQGNVGTHLGNAAIPIGIGQDGNMPNPGYADSTPPAQVKIPTPTVPASGVLAINPTGFVVTVVVTGGTMTAVKVGTAGQTYAQATVEGTGAGTYVIPPNGVIGMTYSVAPTWAWTD